MLVSLVNQNHFLLLVGYLKNQSHFELPFARKSDQSLFFVIVNETLEFIELLDLQ